MKRKISLIRFRIVSWKSRNPVGLMKEALQAMIEFGFNKLEINRIEAEVMQGNIASEKVLSKAGFKKEGILWEWMYWDDQHFDMTMFFLIKSEVGFWVSGFRFFWVIRS